MTAPDPSPPADDEPERPTLEKRVEDALSTVGCLVVFGIVLLLGAFGLRVLGPWGLLALGIGLVVGTIGVAIAVHRIRNRRVLRGFHRAFGPLGKDLLLVTSDSPHWKEYIEQNWLPRWGSRAVVINWSERSRWDGTRPEIALFRRFKEGLEYNPLAIVVAPGARDYAIVRFWKAFREAKHGKPARLEQAEARLALLLEAIDQGRPFDSLPRPEEDPDERRESLRQEFRKRSAAPRPNG